MKNEINLFRLTEFWISILFPLFLSLVFGSIIYLSSDLQLDTSYIGFNTFIEIFRVPLGILALIFPLVALVASNHRSRQSAAQIELGRSQNTFANFHKHKEAFHQMIERLENKYGITFFDPDSLYSCIFPNNSPNSMSYSVNVNKDGYISKVRESLVKLLEESTNISFSSIESLEEEDLIKNFYEELFFISERLKFRVNSGLYLCWTRKYKSSDGEIKETSISLKQMIGIYVDEFYVSGHAILCDEIMRNISVFCQTGQYENAYTKSPLWLFSDKAKEVFNSCKEFGKSEDGNSFRAGSTSPTRAHSSALMQDCY